MPYSARPTSACPSTTAVTAPDADASLPALCRMKVVGTRLRPEVPMRMPTWMSVGASAALLCACDGRPLLYQLVPSEQDVEVLGVFRRIDTGNAGQLTRAQVDGYFKQRFTELDHNRDGALDAEEIRGIVPIFGKKTGSDLLFILDINGDGRVSSDEFQRLSNYLFTRDQNRDGILTLAEAKLPPGDTYVSGGVNTPGVQVTKPISGQPE
jgi:Ca2+-binding EF-hand superfamily protein